MCTEDCWLWLPECLKNKRLRRALILILDIIGGVNGLLSAGYFAFSAFLLAEYFDTGVDDSGYQMSLGIIFLGILFVLLGSPAELGLRCNSGMSAFSAWAKKKNLGMVDTRHHVPKGFYIFYFLLCLAPAFGEGYLNEDSFLSLVDNKPLGSLFFANGFITIMAMLMYGGVDLHKSLFKSKTPFGWRNWVLLALCTLGKVFNYQLTVDGIEQFFGEGLTPFPEIAGGLCVFLLAVTYTKTLRNQQHDAEEDPLLSARSSTSSKSSSSGSVSFKEEIDRKKNVCRMLLVWIWALSSTCIHTYVGYKYMYWKILEDSDWNLGHVFWTTVAASANFYFVSTTNAKELGELPHELRKRWGEVFGPDGSSTHALPIQDDE